MSIFRIAPWVASLTIACATLHADGPADNRVDNVRPVPPPGVAIPETDRAALRQGAAALAAVLEELQHATTHQAFIQRHFSDAAIFHKAVDWALTYNEFYATNEVQVANQLLAEGTARAHSLQQGAAPWLQANGLVARAYRSRIDGSLQPYGLVVPPSWQGGSASPYRLDCWFHGRGEKLTELSFLRERQSRPGEFTPPNTFVLHLYGRYCNANKFAGEIDLLEALEDVQRDYPIDENRIVVRGFSMGGAACWQFAVHYPGRWAAAAPGAGFAETPDFLKVFQSEDVQPTWYERKLWRWYDCTDYALNLYHCPTVAYSGGIDKQKQAADIMSAALKAQGLDLVHIIGPNTGHQYERGARAEINRRIDSIARVGRDPVPQQIHFTTWTLRYNTMDWLRLDGLEEHWERARVDATLHEGNKLTLKTRNVTALTLEMPAGQCPLDPLVQPILSIDGTTLKTPKPGTDRSWTVHLARNRRAWQVVASPGLEGLQKRPGLQGPIDDGFMDSFLVVRPTGSAEHPAVDAWVKAELARFQDHWRRQFRGIAPIVDDVDVTDSDIAQHHLIVWGTPKSNRLLARLAPQLPIQWTDTQLQVGQKKYPAATHVPVLVYPNPLNPQHYVVLNSGFTFREYDYLNNARQVAKLPDFAVVDITTPPNARAPGRIADAGFFDEQWQLKPSPQP